MGTFVTSDVPDPSEEATMRQLEYIHNLLERRRVSARCAQRVILLLEDEPELNSSGLENLKEIIRPS